MARRIGQSSSEPAGTRAPRSRPTPDRPGPVDACHALPAESNRAAAEIPAGHPLPLDRPAFRQRDRILTGSARRAQPGRRAAPRPERNRP